MCVVRPVLILTCVLLATVSVLSELSAAESESIPLHSDTRRLLQDLESDQFSVRHAAQQSIHSLPADQLTPLSRAAVRTASPEAAVRIVTALGTIFQEDNRDDSGQGLAAAEALEYLHQSSRGLIRDEVGFLLNHAWDRRMEYALDRLRTLGLVVILPSSASRQPGPVLLGQSTSHELKLFLTDDWRGSQADLKLLLRLPGVAPAEQDGFAAENAGRTRRGGGRAGAAMPDVKLFLVDGHHLTADETGWLRGAMGQNVQGRGEVMLGITSLAGINGEGCLIHHVEPLGSADLAGLKARDLITAVAEESIDSFEALVEALRRYRAGDTVSLTVVRGSTAPQLKPQTGVVKVRLLSWKEYAGQVRQRDTGSNEAQPISGTDSDETPVPRPREDSAKTD